MEEVDRINKHFVLVHGACHGAWTWYKLKPLLESAGHRVTALDMTASGINLKKLHQISTIHHYSEPLLQFLDSIPPEEKVIIMGHSLGGMNMAVAMEQFPDKISVAVFLAAFMPDTTHKPSYVLDQFSERMPSEAWLDTEISPYGDSENPATSILFGPKFLASMLYQLCSMEDFMLATMLIRPGSLFREDLSKSRKLTNEEGYGCVSRIYIVCKEDKVITEEFQRWMIENSPVKEVKVIEGADHMAMFSKPQQLCRCLLDVALTY